MANKIQVKRGKEVNLPILDVGEPAFTTDSKKPFIGSDSGNIELATKEQINTLEDQLADGTAGIDDSVVSESKVWSSAKTKEQIQVIPKGLNAYEFWLSQGNTGTINDFYRQALRIFVSETEPSNPQEGDILLKVKPLILAEDYYFRFDASTIILEDGANIPQWNDLSGNGNHLVQTDVMKQPIFRKTGLNGKPTVRIYPTAEGGGHLRWFYKDPFTLDRTDGSTMFMVCQMNVITNSVTPLSIVDKANSDVRTFVLYNSGSTQSIKLYANNVDLGSVLNSLDPTIYTTSLSMTQGKILKDGVLAISNPYAGGAIGTHNILTLGSNALGGGMIDGNVSELIYFSRTLTTGEIDAWNAYLKDKWGIV